MLLLSTSSSIIGTQACRPVYKSRAGSHIRQWTPWVASTAALPFPRGHKRIELDQQRCADCKKKSKPNQIEIELLIEKSNRNRSKSLKPKRNITTRYTASRRQDAVPSNTPTHTWFDLYFAHSTSSWFKPTTVTRQRRQRRGDSFSSGQASNAMPFPRPRCVQSTEMCGS